MRTIFHLDLDAFFVSVERIINPDLENKPVIVGADPNGRGVVAACSYEARKFGVHSAMPIGQAYKLCPHGTYLHGHYSEYEKYSDAVAKILNKYAPIVEQASIDEFYMDFTGTNKIYGNMLVFAEKLQNEIWQLLQLPCSIGIGTNKTIAKIASDCYKPKGITYVVPGFEKEFLANMPIEVIPGVGKATLKLLNEKGFYKIKEITNIPQDYFFTTFGKIGIDIWEKANGNGNNILSITHKRKSLSKETTFDADVLEKDKLEKTLFEITEKVCQLLRNEDLVASTITLKLRYTDFVTVTRSKTLNKKTDSDDIIYSTALRLFNSCYTRRVAVRLIGISLSNLSDYTEYDTIFENLEVNKNKVYRAVSKIRDKYGFESIFVGKV